MGCIDMSIEFQILTQRVFSKKCLWNLNKFLILDRHFNFLPESCFQESMGVKKLIKDMQKFFVRSQRRKYKIF